MWIINWFKNLVRGVRDDMDFIAKIVYQKDALTITSTGVWFYWRDLTVDYLLTGPFDSIDAALTNWKYMSDLKKSLDKNVIYVDFVAKKRIS